MLTAIIFFVGTFLLSWMMAGGSTWNFAAFQSGPFPEIDPDTVERQVKDRRFKRPWLEVTLIGSGLVTVAAFLQPPVMLIPMFAGVMLVVAFGGVRGFLLFKKAVAELGIKWPPKCTDSEIGG